jgi:hypothetical protein
MNFVVCHVTVPVVLACVGWDGITMMRHPIGKFVGQDEFVAVLMGMHAVGGLGSCAMAHRLVLLFVC